METDRRAIARNWVLAQEKRKLEQEEREAEYWAKRPMAHPWKWSSYGSIRPKGQLPVRAALGLITFSIPVSRVSHTRPATSH